MPIIFYPHEGDLDATSQSEKLEVLLEAAERYKAIVLDTGTGNELSADPKMRMVPKEIKYAYNWDEIAKILREIRELPENNQANRLTKADRLKKLAEVYEVLRGAKMPKLEAVRIALVNEANQLSKGNSSNSAA